MSSWKGESVDEFSDRIESLNNGISLLEVDTNNPHDNHDIQIFGRLKNSRELIAQLMSNNINQCRSEMFTSISTVIKSLNEIQQIVIHERLSEFERDQALTGGAPLKVLNVIQKMFEELYELIIDTSKLIERKRGSHVPVDQVMYQTGFEEVVGQIKELFQNLIGSSLIVEEQPRQVMRTKTKFNARVRSLLTNSSIYTSITKVTVSILSEEQAKAQHQHNSSPLGGAIGEISNNTGIFELQKTTPLSILKCNLKDMQLTMIKRPQKRNTESITDEKFTLLFQLESDVMQRMQLNVSVMSLPVVVISNVSQEPLSLATIIWDSLFFNVNRIPFEVDDSVPWSFMASALNMKFSPKTGRSLNNENLQYLYQKACKLSIDSYSGERRIKWSEFGKNPLGQTFTFWEWFYAIFKLTRDHLKDPWSKGHIIGFIDKSRTKEILLKCEPGTFLLRFSDTQLGSISISYVEQKMDQTRQVVNLEPFCHKDFDILSLGDRIRDLKECKYLYPRIPKTDAFRRFPKTIKVEKSEDGYVQPLIKMTVPDECEHHNNEQSPDDGLTRDTASGPSFNHPHLGAQMEVNPFHDITSTLFGDIMMQNSDLLQSL